MPQSLLAASADVSVSIPDHGDNIVESFCVNDGGEWVTESEDDGSQMDQLSFLPPAYMDSGRLPHFNYVDVDAACSAAADKLGSRHRLLQYNAVLNRGGIAGSAVSLSKRCSVLVDSGATRDFISQELVEKLGIPTSVTESPFGVRLADGRVINSGRVAHAVSMSIGEFEVERDFHVINMAGLDVILGKPFLFDFDPNISFVTNEMQIVHKGRLYCFDPDGRHTDVLCSSRESPLMSHAEFSYAVSDPTERCYMVQFWTDTVSCAEGGDHLHTLTLEDTDGEYCYAAISPVLEVADDSGHLDTEALERVLKPCSDDETNMPEEASRQILEFLTKHPEVATESERPSKPREVDGAMVYHNITEHPNTTPPFRQSYRLSPSEIKELKKQLDELLQKGFIRPSSSAYGAPVMFVPKADGTLRMVLDYRELNAQTVKDRYSIPRDHDLFDQLQLNGAQYLSSLDLLYGYWQVLVNPDDVHKTAIRTPLGSYEYVVMPMGLCNAPATFQRMMEAVLRPYLTDFCMVYLDDIIIFSRTAEEHTQHILLVLQALLKHGLKIKPKKCEFFKTRIKFLGHIIDVTSGVVQLLPDPDKVDVIAEWVEPTCNKELQSFMGAVNYYSKMIPHYAQIAAPLMDIMASKWMATNKADFWTSAHTAAFVELRRALTVHPVLTLPVPGKPFILQTDASNVALGGVLMQEQESGTRAVVTYLSHKFTDAERNWPVHERELFGLVFSLRKLRHYLMGAEVSYEGDHKPLAWIKTQRHLSPRQARWLETLESFHWTFRHVPGKQLVVPDAISRQPQTAPDAGALLNYLQLAAPDELLDAATTQPYLLATIHQEILERLATMGEHSDLAAAADGGNELDAGDAEQDPLIRVDAVVPDNNTTAVGGLVMSHSLLHRLRHEYLSDEFAGAILAGEERHGYVVQRGIVMRFDSDQAQFPCIYIPATAVQLQQDVLAEYHDAAMGGHLGALKTYEKARRSFYWVNMKADVEAYVKSCEACQRAKRRTTKPPGVNVPYAIPENPFEVIAMDMKSGLPMTARGNNAYWVVVCKLTRRAHIIPCNTTCTAAETARMVFDNVVRHWGVPHKIVSDRDPRFIATFWQELWKLIGTQLNMSTAEHPQTDGSSERYIGTVSGMMRAYCQKDKSDWDLWVAAIEFAYNDSVNAATGYTPFQLSIGRDPAMPITMLLNGILQRPALYAQSDQFVDPQAYLSRFTSIMTAARQELRRTQTRQHQTIQQRLSYPVHYDPGDYVWMEASTLRGPKQTMTPRRHGPYRVMRKVGLNSYELDFGDQSKRHNPVNEEKLSPYLDRASRLPWPSHGVMPGTEAARVNLPLPPSVPVVDGPEGPVDTRAPSGAASRTFDVATVPTSPTVVPLNQPANFDGRVYHNRDLVELQEWRQHEEGDVIKAQVKAKYRNIDEPVWRDLHDVLRSGGFKKAKEFIQKQGGIQHPQLWRSGFKQFQGASFPFITAEYQTRNTEQEESHRPYYVVYSDKDLENLTEEEVRQAEVAQPEVLGALHYVASTRRRNPRVLELCCGTKSASRAIRKLWPGTKIITVDCDPRHRPTILADVLAWQYQDDKFPPGYFDIVWASPPCTEYSLAKTTGVRDLAHADRVVAAVRRIIKYFQPAAWFIENPHALLYLRPIMQDIEACRVTGTYCQYGTQFKKETDIWSNVPITLQHCDITPCAHFQEHGRHARTAQAGPTRAGTPGTPKEEAYQVPQPLMRYLMRVALQACGYLV